MGKLIIIALKAGTVSKIRLSLGFRFLCICQFGNFLNILTLMLQNLYDLNVRKLVVMGLAPIGCAPHYLWQYRSENGKCIESINDMVREFNFLMRYMIEELGEELPDSNIIFCDLFEGSMDIIKNHENYGERCCKSLYCFTQKIVFFIVLIL